MPVFTKKQALRAAINYPLSDDAITKALIEAGLNGDDEFTAADSKAIDICAAGLILVLITSANETEGGFSLSVSDRTSLLTTRSLLLRKWGEPDNMIAQAVQPVIKGIKKW